MAHQVPWDNDIVNAFVKHALLSENEEYIIRSRVYNTPILAQADYLHMSPDNVNKIISKLKKKYDLVQKKHPDELPPRKFSAKELYMDTH